LTCTARHCSAFSREISAALAPITREPSSFMLWHGRYACRGVHLQLLRVVQMCAPCCRPRAHPHGRRNPFDADEREIGLAEHLKHAPPLQPIPPVLLELVAEYAMEYSWFVAITRTRTHLFNPSPSWPSHLPYQEEETRTAKVLFTPEDGATSRREPRQMFRDATSSCCWPTFARRL